MYSMDVSALAHVDRLGNAYLVAGTSGNDAVLTALETRGVSVHGNLDILNLRYAELSVDDVRRIVLPFVSLNPLGDAKFCILSFDNANANAQNALLKSIEDAPGKTHFFLCVETVGAVLPTIRSRCIVVSTPRTKKRSNEHDEEVRAFMREPYEKRLSRVEALVGVVSKTQDKSPAREFVLGLITAARESQVPKDALRDLLDVERYLHMSGASVKTLLSHIAVTLPRTK